MEAEPAPSPASYAEVLSQYLRFHSEAALYNASLLSRACIREELGPEEIIALHGEAFRQAVHSLSYREQALAATDALQFLLEVMIAYGVQHKQFMEMRAAAERLRADNAERAEREKSENLAMVAHELRTPLAAALGSLDLALRALHTGQVERVPRLVGTAREAMQRLSRLSADLLEVSRTDAPPIQPALQELAVVLSQAISWAAAVAEEKGVVLVRKGGPFSVRVQADEDALLTVFGNLLSNALRYTPPGGTVTVEHGQDGSWAWVSIQDTGIGMSQEEQEHVFDQFYRAADARAAESHGLGLGLTLVERLIQAHGGRVDLVSEKGQGSTFRVLLPVVKEPESVPVPVPVPVGDEISQHKEG